MSSILIESGANIVGQNKGNVVILLENPRAYFVSYTAHSHNLTVRDMDGIDYKPDTMHFYCNSMTRLIICFQTMKKSSESRYYYESIYRNRKKWVNLSHRDIINRNAC